MALNLIEYPFIAMVGMDGRDDSITHCRPGDRRRNGCSLFLLEHLEGILNIFSKSNFRARCIGSDQFTP